MIPALIERVKQSKKRIVLPEGEDDRILEAAVHVEENGIANVTLLGDETKINHRFESLSLKRGSITIVDPNDNNNDYAEILFQLRSKKGLTKEKAIEVCRDPLYYADLMVHTGDADACVAGVINSTGNVIRAALQVIGTETKNSNVSSFFILLLNEPLPSPLIFADCAINIEPDAEQLADIAIQSANSAKELVNLEPRVALLSFSTNGSAKHPKVDKVRKAYNLIKQQNPSLNVIGDIQFDAAFSSDVLSTKWSDADFQAPANVFIFPSLEAANIGYKIAERLGNATTIGPILQGLAKPVNDLSRGASVESIINTIVVTCSQVK